MHTDTYAKIIEILEPWAAEKGLTVYRSRSERIENMPCVVLGEDDMEILDFHIQGMETTEKFSVYLADTIQGDEKGHVECETRLRAWTFDLLETLGGHGIISPKRIRSGWDGSHGSIKAVSTLFFEAQKSYQYT